MDDRISAEFEAFIAKKQTSLAHTTFADLRAYLDQKHQDAEAKLGVIDQTARRDCEAILGAWDNKQKEIRDCEKALSQCWQTMPVWPERPGAEVDRGSVHVQFVDFADEVWQRVEDVFASEVVKISKDKKNRKSGYRGAFHAMQLAARLLVPFGDHKPLKQTTIDGILDQIEGQAREENLVHRLESQTESELGKAVEEDIDVNATNRLEALVNATNRLEALAEDEEASQSLVLTLRASYRESSEELETKFKKRITDVPTEDDEERPEDSKIELRQAFEVFARRTLRIRTMQGKEVLNFAKLIAGSDEPLCFTQAQATEFFTQKKEQLADRLHRGVVESREHVNETYRNLLEQTDGALVSDRGLSDVYETFQSKARSSMRAAWSDIIKGLVEEFSQKQGDKFSAEDKADWLARGNAEAKKFDAYIHDALQSALPAVRDQSAQQHTVLIKSAETMSHARAADLGSDVELRELGQSIENRLEQVVEHQKNLLSEYADMAIRRYDRYLEEFSVDLLLNLVIPLWLRYGKFVEEAQIYSWLKKKLKKSTQADPFDVAEYQENRQVLAALDEMMSLGAATRAVSWDGATYYFQGDLLDHLDDASLRQRA